MAGRIVQGRPCDSTGGTVASSSAGGPVRVTLSAPTTSGNKRHHLQQLLWSVDAAPSAQTITVYDGTTGGATILQFEVGSSGHDGMFLPPLRTSPNNAATVVLSSASTGYVYLNVMSYTDD